MEKQLNIPAYWEQISLVDDFIYVPTGVENYEGKKPYYSTGSIKTQANTVEGEYSSIDRPSRANRIAKKGDVLQARMKDTNKALIIDQGLDGALFSTGFFQVRPYNNTYSAKLLYYYLFSNSFLNAKNDLCSGSTQSALNDMQAKKLYVPLPPLAEQYRIVDKIESLFSELDSSIDNLKTAKEQLKRYRQSVLKSAFEGKLTVEWREANGDKLETAEALMERIKAEREAMYETKLTEWKEAVNSWENGGKEGKKPSKPTKPKVFTPLSSEDIVNLPELPEGWGYLNLGNLNLKISDGPFGSNLKSSDYVDNGVRVIRLENIGNLEFYDDKKTYITEEKYEVIKKHTVKSGDIIFSSFIASEGTCVVKLPNHINKAINKADCFCIRVFGQTVSTEYLTLFLSSRNVYAQLEVQVHGATRPRINTTQLSYCQVPIPSIIEQDHIVNEIELRFSEADVMERTIDESLIKAEKMRQSILKKAFEGKLLSQYPNEEPVIEVLRRIKEEKIKYQKDLKAQKKKATPKVEKQKMEILETLKKHEGWVSAQDIFEQYTNEKDTDTIEGFYQKLRVLLNDDVIEVRRETGVDWFRTVKDKG